MWALSINSTKILTDIKQLFQPINEQTGYYSLCYQPCLLLPPPLLMPCPPSTKIRWWQHLRGNYENVEVRDRTTNLQLPSLMAAGRSCVEKRERSYFCFSVAPSLCLVIHCLTDQSTRLVGKQKHKQAPRWAECRNSCLVTKMGNSLNLRLLMRLPQKSCYWSYYSSLAVTQADSKKLLKQAALYTS